MKTSIGNTLRIEPKAATEERLKDRLFRVSFSLDVTATTEGEAGECAQDDLLFMLQDGEVIFTVSDLSTAKASAVTLQKGKVIQTTPVQNTTKTGIFRRMDDLARVLIPKAVRQELTEKSGVPLLEEYPGVPFEISVQEVDGQTGIFLVPYKSEGPEG